MKMNSVLCDTHDDNALSSKRVITLLAFIFCTIAFFANLFFDKTMDSFIYETMAWIVLGGMTATAAEKFTKSSKE
jgi:FtsH-binding integral membrane protein